MNEHADGCVSAISSAVKKHTKTHHTVSPCGEHLREVLSVFLLVPVVRKIDVVFAIHAKIRNKKR